MLDFAKLARRTPIEQEADELRRQAEATALDRTRRRERSHRSIALTLTLDAELRFTVAGGSCLHLRGRDVRART
ncbi:MAG: hypothetical protein ACREDI_10140, partial [Roseiarcus sp.]